MIELREGVPGVNAPAPATYEEFWPYYVSQHLHPLTRVAHVTGTSLGIVLFVVAVLTSTWLLVPLAFAVGYGFAFASHFIWEGNRPATFGNPAWSFRADFRQLARFYTGRLGDDVAAVRASLGLRPEHRTLADAAA